MGGARVVEAVEQKDAAVEQKELQQSCNRAATLVEQKEADAQRTSFCCNRAATLVEHSSVAALLQLIH